ncbi:hypothetical protein CWO91_24300 [Bradyrhizobium genosp. SA-3]|nr:hypothetical protein CWO91_24300 [Bradyrhizobium genosp. SA-3]
MAVFVAVMYLLSGALHGTHDIDVTSPSGGSEIASILEGSTGHGDHKAIGGHHCHGCFSVTVAQPALSAASVAHMSASRLQRGPRLAGIIPATDSPPPKHIA